MQSKYQSPRVSHYENRLPVSPSNRKRQESSAAKQQGHAANAVFV
jgi:hypothetical protein